MKSVIRYNLIDRNIIKRENNYYWYSRRGLNPVWGGKYGIIADKQSGIRQ